ncbi:MAG: DMT family transporter [Thermoplasmata archaeon]|nr:DMT family transporter [Thermoplasmata archaeon]
MPPRRPSWENVALFGLVAFAWGLNYLFVRVGLTFAPPLWLAVFRSGLGALTVGGFLLIQGGWRTLDRRDVRDALLIGVPNTAIFFGLWFLAASAIPPGETAVLVYTFPLWVTLLSGPLLRTTPSAWQWVAVSTGFFGVILVSQPWVGGAGSLAPGPVVELLAGSIAWAFGTIAFKRRFTGPKVVPANAMQLTGGALALLVVAPLMEGTFLPPSSGVFLAVILWLGVLGTALAYSIWFRLLDRLPAATLSGYTFLVPLVALTASLVLLGDTLGPLQVVGVAAVLLAIYLNSRGARDRVARLAG